MVLLLGALVAMIVPTPRAGAAPLSADDAIAITQTVTGVGLFADLRDWPRVGALLGDDVVTDYTSVFGGDVTTVARDALLRQWRDALGRYDATQHLITNVSVTGGGDRAETLSHVRATHWLDGQSWTIGGVYTHRLVRASTGWQVRYMQLSRLYEEGVRL